MDLQLKNKTALVTGSSAGIGKAIALALAAEGATVIVHGRDAERTKETANAITRAGGIALSVFGDLSTDKNAAKVIEQINSVTGSVDILINNAGRYDLTTWDNVTSKHWEETLNADILSAVRLIQAFLPEMKAKGWGRIIQIGSGSGHQPFATQPQYCAMKAAMNNLTVSLARSLKGTGVLSNIVTPGLIYVKSVEEFFTPMKEQMGWGDGWENIEAGVIRDLLPNDIGKMGQTEDIACVVTFLCSPLARFVSGANWRVDGGSSVAMN
jgi:NAD(P)-dependent dehydrogenase (short-subunit alcohol dehydrogenase family)